MLKVNLKSRHHPSSHTDTLWITASISTKHQRLINRLLKNARYSLLNQLRKHLEQQHPAINFYMLLTNHDYFTRFFAQSKLSQNPLFAGVKDVIDQFLQEFELEFEFNNHQELQSSNSKSKTNIKKLIHDYDNATSEEEKIKILSQVIDENGQTLGHLYPTRARYIEILRSLKPRTLFSILKLENADKQSIFSLYNDAEPGYINAKSLLCDLIAKCSIEDPKTCCDIIEYFNLDNKILQRLVNRYGVKTDIRNYLVNLSDEPAHWHLLERCLNPDTAMGKFCAMKAKRLPSMFSAEKTPSECSTITRIREKLRTRLAQTEEQRTTQNHLINSIANDEAELDPIAQPTTSNSAQFLLLVGVMAAILTLINLYASNQQETSPVLRPS